MSDAADFLATHPGLEDAMRVSEWFPQVREAAVFEVDAERLYIVRGDTLGDEADLYLETLVRGARSEHPDDTNRAVFLELDDELQEVVRRRAEGSAPEGTGGLS
jgi:hypothetical protein